MNGYVGPLSLLLTAAVGVAVLYLGASRLNVTASPLRTVPFESGGWPTEHAVSRFHARWYALTLLFLAFDIEMLFMYPWALVVAEMGASAVIEMFSFLAVLMVGVLYAWREGALRWA